jgi:hypothetical protein
MRKPIPLSLCRISLCMAALSVAVVGCHRKEPAKDIPQVSDTPAHTQGVIPQAQLDALNKAKAVESMLNEAQQQRRQAEEQQEQE